LIDCLRSEPASEDDDPDSASASDPVSSEEDVPDVEGRREVPCSGLVLVWSERKVGGQLTLDLRLNKGLEGGSLKPGGGEGDG
jgi:hypothetical protein